MCAPLRAPYTAFTRKGGNAYGRLLLALAANVMDDEAYLRICRGAGMPRELLVRVRASSGRTSGWEGEGPQLAVLVAAAVEEQRPDDAIQLY